MKCPRCEAHRFSLVSLDEGLSARECGNCGGHWLPSFQYWRWLEKHGPNLPEKPKEEGFDAPTEGLDRAMICPECEHILVKAAAGHDLTFRVDRCYHCGGIWLDANEWEALKSRNLHDDIHLMYTQTWRKREGKSPKGG